MQVSFAPKEEGVIHIHGATEKEIEEWSGRTRATVNSYRHPKNGIFLTTTFQIGNVTITLFS